jgi:hypothetical protein
MGLWPLLLIPAGLGWWALGFPPGWGWIVTPIVSTMPVNAGELAALIAVVLGLYGGLVWLRNNL